MGLGYDYQIVLALSITDFLWNCGWEWRKVVTKKMSPGKERERGSPLVPY